MFVEAVYCRRAVPPSVPWQRPTVAPKEGVTKPERLPEESEEKETRNSIFAGTVGTANTEGILAPTDPGSKGLLRASW